LSQIPPLLWRGRGRLGGGDKMFVHPPLYPLPSREGALILDTLQLVGALRKSRLSGAAGWFIALI